MFLCIRMRHYETACLCQYYLSLFLSPPYPLSLKRIGDKVIMLRFSVRQEPFAVTGLLNVFLLRWGLCAVEPQWTELLAGKKEKCSFWSTCSINHLSCGNRVICISPAAAGGSAYESRHDWSFWAFQGWAKCKNWLPFNSWARIRIELAMSHRMLNLNWNQIDWKINIISLHMFCDDDIYLLLFNYMHH